ncbi:hypothetical protein [Rhizobium sullae]|uniref:Uncharacterized protein n=2 Tax=Rhizobium sullae TaxID=50338 RepID=A0A4R3PTA2_RHISU|nr:hypothetical protein [Rhizobium sullae]TCU07007.1 hypothetical protein EV132_13037 [Rhizobium sullae]
MWEIDMTKTFDLSEFSDEDLASLIEEARTLQDSRRASRNRAHAAGVGGSKGQDLKNLDHGAIPTPTPREVKDEGPAHGVPE